MPLQKLRVTILYDGVEDAVKAEKKLTTLLPPDGGTARVAGCDVVREGRTLRERALSRERAAS